ncbi:enoyl-CoA hydratase-related protein [Streptomyces gilvus]|uniref:enoyl-CoA hydratase-related protein n=1 Tax=Streptomyces gilvus TaxID=2920937 RepID=UPI001F0F8338|nr:enoyl-CoA hydratase-related protein [Streptomyces sp. CME 23]MCH5677576.1 enoyl-CoA hydratase-related protein [Streptomyces sp. CME 23]
MSEHILTEVAGGVLTVTLNRPERLNAWTMEMGDAYFDVLDRADDDPGIRVVVLTGAGRGFCAGIDMEVLGAAAGGRLPRPAAGRRMTHAQSFRKPLIAAVNGACVGFGLVQALACDIRFAAASAYFLPAFAQRGLNAEYGTSWLLPRMIGQTRATEWLFSGRRMDAAEAERVGLVNGVRDDENLLDQTLDYARRLARTASPTALADTKAQIAGDWLRDRTAAEDHAKELGHAPGHRVDFEEGVRSFLDRRPPDFAPLTPRSPDPANPLAPADHP